MDFKQEDDFWNATSGNSFAFDDELEYEPEDAVEEDINKVFHSSFEVSNALPLRTIISAKNLELILEDVKVPRALAQSPVEETIHKLTFDEDCSLADYKSECDKLYLLDKVIETNDGNIILKVILFIAQTLRQNIFFRHLTKRPIAFNHYYAYLVNMEKLSDLELLLMATGNKDALSHFFYISTQNTSANNIHKKLGQFNIVHLESLSDEFEKSIFQQHKKFLDYKMEHNFHDEAPSTIFAQLVYRKLDNLSVNDPDLQNFLKLTKMSNFKCDWIMMNVIAANERWPILNTIFQKEKWFNIKAIRKYNVSIELIVCNLYKHGAPRGILEEFLKNMDDSDKALYFGQKFKCHTFVIDTFVARKDRDGLSEYKKRLDKRDSEWFQVIDNAMLRC